VTKQPQSQQEIQQSQPTQTAEPLVATNADYSGVCCGFCCCTIITLSMCLRIRSKQKNK
jgi:hypothetical protein